MESTGDKAYKDKFEKGLTFFTNYFFEPNGRPKYYHNRTYPVDVQCASQAIETLSNLNEYDDTALDLALAVAKWTIDKMQDETGYFYYRQYPYRKEKTPMMHWGQATTYKAMAHLLLRINEISPSHV
jgi:hypothetical protein